MKTLASQVTISQLNLFDQNDLLREMAKQNQDDLQFVDWAFENDSVVYGCMNFNNSSQGPDYWLDLCEQVAKEIDQAEFEKRYEFSQFLVSDNVTRLSNGKYAEQLTQYSLEMTLDELYEFFVKEYC